MDAETENKFGVYFNPPRPLRLRMNLISNENISRPVVYTALVLWSKIHNPRVSHQIR